jgi:hypothetical protein
MNLSFESPTARSLQKFNDVCFLPKRLPIEFMIPLTERHREKAVGGCGEIVRDTIFIREKTENFYGFENSQQVLPFLLVKVRRRRCKQLESVSL